MTGTWPPTLIATTAGGVRVVVSPGKKSEFDFRVRVREPGKRLRTPKHIHIITDLYVKAARSPLRTAAFVDVILSEIVKKVTPSKGNPPRLQVNAMRLAPSFADISPLGEYSADYLLCVIELIAIQERTNYVHGDVTERMFRAFRNSTAFGGRGDLYSVISAATWRGRRAK